MATRIPINNDNFDFEDRQDSIWDKMERDMERRRKEWEDEIERMRKDFFDMGPQDNRKYETLSDKISSSMSENVDDARGAIEKDANGRPVFRAKFDVRDYKPDEVHVKTDANKIIVKARHEEKGGTASVSREYSREINIPREIDPIDLQCTMSPEGVLILEAPLPAPKYAAVGEPPKQEKVPTTKVSSVSFQTSAVNTPPTYHTPPPSHQPQPVVYMSPSTSAGYPSTGPPPSTMTYQIPNPASGPPSANIKFQATPTPFYTSSAATPTYQVPSAPTSLYQTSTKSSSSTVRTGSPVTVEKDRKFKMEIDIEDFAPEELMVKTVDKKLVISARREEKIGNRTSTKELSREYHIPETVDPFTVKAFFTDGGKLIVEAPIKQTTNGGPGGYIHAGSPMTGR